MNDPSVKPISGVRPPERGAAASEATRRPSEAHPAQRPAAPRPDAAPAAHASPSNISIHFRLDDHTQELTVFIVDRATKQVLRSIPASELHRLRISELMELTA